MSFMAVVFGNISNQFLNKNKMGKIFRNKISFWILWGIGIAALGGQFYRYWTGTLEGSWLDIAVFIIAIGFVMFPKSLADIVESWAKSKTGMDDEK